MSFSRLMTSDELLRFERKWKIIFTVFGIVLIGALLDYLTRRPNGWEAVICYGGGAGAFAGCIFSARRLGDGERLGATEESLELLDEDLAGPIDVND